MTCNPVSQPLAPGRFSVGVTGAAEHRNKDLGGSNFAGGLIDDVNRRAGIINKQLFTGNMLLAHAALLAPAPLAIKIAVAAVFIGYYSLSCCIL